MRNSLINSDYVSGRGHLVLSDRLCRASRKPRRRVSYQVAFVCVLGLLLLLLLVFLRMSADKVEAKADYEKIFVAVEIQPGDTLWAYAGQYAHPDYYPSRREYIQEVCDLNGLGNGTIYAGKTIALPVIRLRSGGGIK